MEETGLLWRPTTIESTRKQVCQTCLGNGIVERIDDAGYSRWITCPCCDGSIFRGEED